MALSIERTAAATPPHIILPQAVLEELIAFKGDAVIHQQASMDERFGLEVVAGVETVSNVKQLRLLASFKFHASLSETEIANMQDEYIANMQAYPLDEFGVVLRWMNNYKKSVVLKEESATDAKVVTWFSPARPAPHLLSVGNYREVSASEPREEKVRNFKATPPVYDPETFGDEIISFMQLLAVPHRALGSKITEYRIDLVGEPKPDKQQRSRQKGKTESASKHSATALRAGPKPEHDRTWAVQDKKYAPRVANPSARLDQVHGLHEQDREKIDERLLTFVHPEIAKDFGAAGGGAFLFYGEGGVGKTMLATAIANEAGGTIWEVGAQEFIDCYVGNSAKHSDNILEDAIRRAEAGKKPHVLMINELETVVGSKATGDHDASSERQAALGVVKKKFEYIAAQVPNLLIVATANNEDFLDPNFIRDGRFVKFYLQKPDEDARFHILQDNLTWEVQGQEIFDKEDILYKMPHIVSATDGMTGATISEIAKICQVKKFKERVTTGAINGLVSASDILEVISSHRKR